MSSDILSTRIPLLDFRSWKVRKEYTAAAVRIFFNIMDKWDLGPGDACLLLGGISNRYYRQLKARQEGRILSPGRLYRISYLVGIYKALNIAYDGELADRFVHLPNGNRLFGGSTPLSYMIEVSANSTSRCLIILAVCA